MKDNLKWIIAAIVVLLVILVGAYALSNGGNQPVVNASVTPDATATPTSTPAISPTAAPPAAATPTITPTITPTVTPTPKPSGSIQQTQFGYVITYPPFAESYDIHVNPYYTSRAATTISFASDSNLYREDLQDVSYPVKTKWNGQIGLVRTDSLNGSVTAHVILIANSTFVPLESVTYESAITFEDQQSTAPMHLNIDYGTFVDDGNFVQGIASSPDLTFEIVPDSSYNVGAINQFGYYIMG